MRREIALDDVALFDAVLQVEAVTDRVEGRIELHAGGVGAVHDEAPVKRVVHRHVARRRAAARLAHHVEVDGVSPAHVGLSHAVEFHVGEVQGCVDALGKDVAAIPVQNLVRARRVHLKLTAVRAVWVHPAVGQVARRIPEAPEPRITRLRESSITSAAYAAWSSWA